MERQADYDSFYISAEAARVALARVRECRIHPQFAGYLAAVYSNTAVKSKDLRVDFSGFFDKFLRVSDAPLDRPFLQPFSPQIEGTSLPLFNGNVAGSYAPSSIRAVAPIRKVLAFHGKGQSVAHSLMTSHEALAFDHLAYKSRIPLVSLATLLYRDHSVPKLSSDPFECTIKLFCRDFGYRRKTKSDEKRMNTLYILDRGTFAGVEYAESN